MIAYLIASTFVPLARYVLYPQAAAASAHDSHAIVLPAEPSVASVCPLSAFDPFQSIAPANPYFTSGDRCEDVLIVFQNTCDAEKGISGLCTQVFCEFMTSTDRFAAAHHAYILH